MKYSSNHRTDDNWCGRRIFLFLQRYITIDGYKVWWRWRGRAERGGKGFWEDGCSNVRSHDWVMDRGAESDKDTGIDWF